MFSNKIAQINTNQIAQVFSNKIAQIIGNKINPNSFPEMYEKPTRQVSACAERGKCAKLPSSFIGPTESAIQP
jgi:hypothetical protein